MTSFGEASISLIQSTLPTNTVTNVTAGALILVSVAFVIHYTSPMRLTAALVAALHETEEAHLGAVEAGVLSGSDVHTDMLSECAKFSCIVLFLTNERSLQMKVSIIHEASLCNSLSNGQAVRELFKDHTLTLLQCIWEVQGLKIRIEVSPFFELRFTRIVTDKRFWRRDSFSSSRHQNSDAISKELLPFR
ncbi:hypothetical protein FB451DRAFT_512424 [Mycena latifolia]|nr:hypothetical protein FB451DRAFT_512424 [Mycena latifolia]